MIGLVFVIIILSVALVVSLGILNARTNDLMWNRRRVDGLEMDYANLMADYRQLSKKHGEPQPQLDPQKAKALEGLKVVVAQGMMTEQEAEKMAVQLGLGTFTPGTGTGDDVCPECGNKFDVTDDYVCEACRAKMDA